ncbi:MULTISPECIES: DeoR/GlpR family DNA-binding transcription regulator [Clostridium]|jgi:DeoR family fructose operon transcriptional repressor|uniref:DeoR/GlpR family DNA-binding transcription regulator n=1 Tax=Clostridium TaxID=1485 RepID=UPI0006C05BC6|nr:MULTISPECIES: DeoR/GlpR family DNA-binding transcription regulator [Clostridium]MBX9185385.1 DeoR/GlpR transcriptional regulator [Clostridium sp. K04]MDU3520957.1 DeoR/GlpR family DNA-binding transcription regulator [Clostridium saudiense]MDU7454182.1 DeoR/GlpR family DNA-binding transcription regulator [Clostridium saudiense]MEE0726997.1 DeoR/GlpR family DNA-binding transcription regulator [Clostridium saudiense]CUN87079.1 sugar metabolism transcriptional regulator [Clostridium disporicum]
MVLIDRWIEISEFVKEKKYASIDEIMEKFQLSRSTVRRTLIAMEEKKLLKRVRGGAEAIEEVDAILPMDFQEVFNANKEDKIIIAKKAASLIQDNDVIFIDSGSTCFYMIDYIKAKEITVVTNGIMHIQKLMAKGINTYILGGYAKPEKNLIMGEDMVNKISVMNFDKAFLGTMGIDARSGFTTMMLEDGEVKKAVIKSSDKCYILADKSKFNVRKFYTYGDFTEATIITNSEIKFEEGKAKIIY